MTEVESEVPYGVIMGGSAFASFLLVRFTPKVLVFDRPTYLGTFVELILFELLAWAFYKVVLYPKYLSPLRHLPGPKNESWWNGNFGRVLREVNGGPAMDWYAIRDVPRYVQSQLIPHQDADYPP